MDSVVDRASLAYEDLLDCLIAALAQMEPEVVKALPYHHLAIFDSQQVGLELALVVVVRPASQLDSAHRILVALGSVPLYIFGKF